MSIDASDILACAKDLAKRLRMSEAHARAIIGRAYYGAFHNCKAWHAALPAPGRLPVTYKGGGEHAELINRLRNPDPSLVRERRDASADRGKQLAALRTLRNEADYDLQAKFDEHDAHSAIADAVSLCNSA